MAKTTCPITRNEFAQHAVPVSLAVGGVPMVAPVKEFSTGSVGWYLSGKTMVTINGKPVTVQVGLSMTIVGSKELPAVA